MPVGLSEASTDAADKVAFASMYIGRIMGTNSRSLRVGK